MNCQPQPGTVDHYTHRAKKGNPAIQRTLWQKAINVWLHWCVSILTTKGTKLHEGSLLRWIPWCTFVVFVVVAFA